jgi:hypothetical protein
MPALTEAELAVLPRVRVCSPVRGLERLECLLLAESVVRHLEQVSCRGQVMERLECLLLVASVGRHPVPSVGRHPVPVRCQELGRGVRGQAADRSARVGGIDLILLEGRNHARLALAGGTALVISAATRSS